VAAAAAGLADPLGAPWLKSAGVVAALVFAVALFVVKAARLRLEKRREQWESDRRLRIPVTPAAEVDPLSIGVERAAQSVLPGGEHPAYLPRGVDTAVREGILAAVEGRGRWLVVMQGPSKVGKSRTLFEGLLAADAKVQVVAPINGDAVKALLVPGQAPRWNPGSKALWLDDLEPFLNDGVTWQTLREWHAGARPDSPRIVLATYGGKGSERIAGSTTAGLATTAGEMLQHALEIPLAATSPSEEANLPDAASDADRAAIRQSGLAAFLVAGPALERKLRTGLHAPGAAPCPAGAVLVDAVVDWTRCGRTDPISDTLLRQVCPATTPGADFATALAWATNPVAGNIALITHTPTGSTAYDYVVRLRRDNPDTPPPPDPIWTAAITTASPAQANSVAYAAYEAGRLTDAAAALDRARIATTPELAAQASNNYGVVLSELGRGADAVAVYQRVVDDHGDDPSPGVRGQVAKALINRGCLLGELGRGEDELALYQRVVDDYGDDPNPAVRERVAKALFNRGVALGALGRGEDELAVYQRMVDDYGDDPSPVLRELGAKALFNWGHRLGALGRGEDAVAVYQRVVDDYGDDPSPALRAQVAKALVNRGYQLGALGRGEDAVAVYQRVVDDYGDDPSPALRAQVAMALVNRGYRLGELGRGEDAVAMYRRVITDYGGDPGLSETVRRARRAMRVGDHRER
jgi:tetratricopeptide (TPR) repeat protein